MGATWLLGPWQACFCSFQHHLPAVTPTAPCFILLTPRPDLPHPPSEALGAQRIRDPPQPGPFILLAEDGGAPPTPTFPLLLLTGEQGGQAVLLMGGLGLLQRGQESGCHEAWEFESETGVLDPRV